MDTGHYYAGTGEIRYWRPTAAQDRIAGIPSEGQLEEQSAGVQAEPSLGTIRKLSRSSMMQLMKTKSFYKFQASVELGGSGGSIPVVEVKKLAWYARKALARRVNALQSHYAWRQARRCTPRTPSQFA